MTPYLSADQQEQIKMAQRSQRKLGQGFQMFTYFIATGITVHEAIEKMESAMETWTEYEDHHQIDIPLQQNDVISQMMGKFNEVMAAMAPRPDDSEIDAEFSSPEELCVDEQRAWDEYQALKSEVEALHESMPPEATEQMGHHVLSLERQWRSFGTAQLRLQIAQLSGVSVDLSLRFHFGPDGLVCRAGNGQFAFCAYEEVDRQRAVIARDSDIQTQETLNANPAALSNPGTTQIQDGPKV